MFNVLAFQMPGLTEWVIIGVIAVLLFGRRLPEIGRSLGKGITEFKKGLNGVEDQLNVTGPVTQNQTSLPPEAPLGNQPRFDPYTGEPLKARFDPYTGKPL